MYKVHWEENSETDIDRSRVLFILSELKRLPQYKLMPTAVIIQNEKNDSFCLVVGSEYSYCTAEILDVPYVRVDYSINNDLLTFSMLGHYSETDSPTVVKFEDARNALIDFLAHIPFIDNSKWIKCTKLIKD